MWRRNSKPRPTPRWAPSIRPGMSARTRVVLRSSSATPRLGCKVGNGDGAILGCGEGSAGGREGPLPGVRPADDADVGDELQLERQPPPLAGRALFGHARRLNPAVGKAGL